jgi:peptide/nickel transport system substrate-binding protein
MYLWFGALPRAHEKNPLADPRVRRAVALAVDPGALSGSVLGDPRMAASGLVPTTIFGYTPTDADRSQAQGRARRLLVEAGFPEGFDVPMIYGPYPLAVKTAGALSRMLAVVGIRVELRGATSDAVLAAALGGNATGFVVEQWTYDDGDAGSFLRDCIHSRNASRGEGVFNPGFSDAAIDRLIDEALVLVADSARLARYHAIMERAAECVPAVPLFDRRYVYGLAPGVRWAPRADGFILAAEITPAE